MQQFIVILIIALSFGYAGYRLYHSFRAVKSSGCQPDKCGSCPYIGKDGCGAGNNTDGGPACPL